MGDLPPVRIRPSLTWGWEWNVGHGCSYVYGAGGYEGAGWRPTRRGAIRAGARYRRGLARRLKRAAWDWETVPEEVNDDHDDDDPRPEDG